MITIPAPTGCIPDDIIKEAREMREQLEDAICSAQELTDELVPALEEISEEIRSLHSLMLRCSISLQYAFPYPGHDELPFP